MGADKGRALSTNVPSRDDFLVLDSVLSTLFHGPVVRRIQTLLRRWSPILQFVILFLIFLLCIFIRQFSVIRYESVIHEFDPYFNYRTTKYLANEGFYEFWNWFDFETWYPLGRVVGQTLYPGLMSTSKLIYSFLHSVGIVVDIKDICVFIGPLFSGLTAIAGYLLAKEASGITGAGLFSALFLGICPSYISRSVAGSYDNEAVAIFALVFSFYLWIRSLRSGTMMSAMIAALATFYMVLTWGGYVFVINTVAVFMVILIFIGKFTMRHYIVYSVFYIIMTILCLNVPFVNFAAVTSSEHMTCHGVFILVNALTGSQFLRGLLPSEIVRIIIQIIVAGSTAGFVLVFLWLTATERTSWSARSLTLLDPTYASKYIPIIASVAEHQPTTWSTYILDLHFVSLLAPLGLIIAFKKSTDGMLFVGIYGILAAYFSGVMVRLMLVLAPAAAIMAGIGASHFVGSFLSYIRIPTAVRRYSGLIYRKAGQIQSESTSIPLTVAIFFCVIFGSLCTMYVSHCTWTSSIAYSHPSIILSSRLKDGTRLIQDDFREAYYWFRQNTHPKAKLMSWWDYGYQTTAMGNRTVLVDNNTWNNTHIATVGLAFASNEEDSYEIMHKLDVDYVFVIFGGMARFQSDDINKFLWMIRIASGVYPHIQQADYLTPQGTYSIGMGAPTELSNCLMYKLCYYRFAEASTQGFDLARNTEINRRKITLKYFEEVYTTENWLVRIYKVKSPSNRLGIF